MCTPATPWNWTSSSKQRRQFNRNGRGRANLPFFFFLERKRRDSRPRSSAGEATKQFGCRVRHTPKLRVRCAQRTKRIFGFPGTIPPATTTTTITIASSILPSQSRSQRSAYVFLQRRQGYESGGKRIGKLR